MSPNPPPAKSPKPAAARKAAALPAKNTSAASAKNSKAANARRTKGSKPKAAPKPPPRFAGLDGLRAIAVLSVVAYHLFPGTLIGGYIGVDLFFVISGFLITALLLRQKESLGKIDLKGFWVRRARRLLPALFLLLIVICSVAAMVGGNVLIDLGRQILGAVTFSSNWLSILSEHSYFTESNPELFRNLWSLAVEEQFYLIWPLALLLLLLLPYRRLRWVLLAGVAVASGL
ncbi:MAG: acyltransferase, partial [Cryobacterium sp.]|nr:acyltransferase [Cryobacterium sp.]